MKNISKIELISKTTTKKQKIVGRGYGSGKGGHTSGRGQKGQKSRGGLHILFEGVKVKKSFLKRLPFMRGKGRFSPVSQISAVGISKLNVLKDNSEVTLAVLKELGLVKKATKQVKIINDGETLSKKLTVKLPVTKGAKSLIEKSGGSCIS